MKREFLDRTADYTLRAISASSLGLDSFFRRDFPGIVDNRNFHVGFVLKYPVLNNPHPCPPPAGLPVNTCFKQHNIFMVSKSSPGAQPASFEDAMTELEQLVSRMEAGELPLEASVAAYRRGSELVKYCAGQLDKVDSQVKVLEGDMLKPYSDDGAAIEVDE
jgi:exodeoxyribonuclease VII small subunit